MKLSHLVFAGTLLVGCDSRSQDRTGSPISSAAEPTAQNGGTMTNAPNGKDSHGSAKDDPQAPSAQPIPRRADDVPAGKDVALSWSSKQTPKDLAIHYRIKSLSNADIWVFDRLWSGSGSNMGRDPEGAYRFERGGNLRLLLGAAPLPRRTTVLMRVMPFARRLPAQGMLEGDLTMAIPVSEYSVYFTESRNGVDPSAAASKHVERVTLMLQYVLVGPDLPAQKVKALPDVFKLPAFALADAKVALSEMPLALEVLRRTDNFDRVDLPGEASEPF